MKRKLSLNVDEIFKEVEKVRKDKMTLVSLLTVHVHADIFTSLLAQLFNNMVYWSYTPM